MVDLGMPLFLPYHPHDQPIPAPKGFDGTFYSPGMEMVPKKATIVRADRYMADNCTHLIAYAWHPASNVRKLVEYVQRWQIVAAVYCGSLAGVRQGGTCPHRPVSRSARSLLTCI